MKSVIAYIATTVFFVAVDLLWLGFVARDYYRGQLELLLADKFNLGAGLAFYLIYSIGIFIFATQPAIAEGGWTRALTLGLLFGFFAYATYDLTNLATLRDWPLQVSLVDMAWGAVLTGMAAAAGVAVADRF